MCRSKIKGGTVTEKKLYYEGSITIDRSLIEAAEILPGEMVNVLNVNNGARIETYVIEGKAGSGDICLNGPSARFFEVGDRLIILSTGLYDEEELRRHTLKIVELSQGNRIVVKAEG